MEFRDMNIEELNARKAAILSEVEAEGADLDALESEIKGINKELEQRKRASEERTAKITDIVHGAGEIIEIKKEERKTMGIDEIRNSKEYIQAYAEYVKSGDDREARALLTVNAVENNGTVPVPTFLEGYVRTAWENNGILSLIRRSYFRGNLQIGFEKSATAAEYHNEGDPEPNEEALVMGVINLIPKSIKKWITISDEAMDMTGEEFLYYIYDEITYKIAQFAASQVVSDITAVAEAASANAPAVAKISAALALDTVVQAIAQLADNADNPVIVINKQTYADIKALQLTANYAVDPFDGLRVIFNNTLDAYSKAAVGKAYMIVGDFRGYQANFPNGEDITLKFDDISLAEKDLVKIVGRMFVAMGVVAPNHFTVVTKPSTN